MKVLVVDDEKLIVWSIRRALEKDGMAVVTASSAEEAKSHLAKETFDLVITDDKMPGLCGQDLIKEVSRKSSSGTKCLLMSGSLSPEKTDSACADGYIEKPFLLRELKEKIREVLA